MTVRHVLAFGTLRAKVLVAFVIVSALLTWGTLLVVRYRVQIRVDADIARDLRNSVSTFQTLQQQRNATLSASAALLANQPLLKALMTSQDRATIQDASSQFWDLIGSELFVLVDREGELVALHTARSRFSRDEAASSLAVSLASGQTPDWWFGGGALFQVFFQPIYLGAADDGAPLGLVGVGFQIDEQFAADIARVASSEVAFHYGTSVVVTTVTLEPATVLRPLLLRPPGEAPSSEDLVLGVERFLATSVDVAPASLPPVRLTVLKSYDEANTFLRSLNQWILGLGLLALLGGGAVIYAVSTTITRPLAELVDGVRALEAGDFTYPLKLSGRDEVSTLTATFDRMRRTLLEAQRRLVDNERLAVIGRMASSISHDLRHPLTAIMAYAEFLTKDDITPDQRSDFYQEIRVAVNRMTEQIGSLLGFSRSGEALQLAETSLDGPIAQAIQTVRVLPEFEGLTISWTCAPNCRGWFDAGKVERIVLNLLVNACEATSAPDGVVNVDCRPTPTGVEIRVSDNGPGIPREIRDQLFDPFVSAEKEQGIGLGLTAVQMIVQEHGGAVTVERTGPDGTVFHVTLPSGPSETEAASERTRAEE